MTVRHPRQRRAKQKGFSLIEVLVAMIVLGIGIVGLAGMQVATLKYNHSALLRSQASMLAYEISDAVRANRADAASYNVNFDNVVVAPATIPEQDLARWKNRIAAVMPGGQGQIAPVGNNTVVSIRWDDSRGEAPLQVFTYAFRP